MEVAAPLSEQAFVSDTFGSGFTSVVYTSLEGFAFVFAGTTNGTLHQVCKLLQDIVVNSRGALLLLVF